MAIIAGTSTQDAAPAAPAPAPTPAKAPALAKAPESVSPLADSRAAREAQLADVLAEMNKMPDESAAVPEAAAPAEVAATDTAEAAVEGEVAEETAAAEPEVAEAPAPAPAAEVTDPATEKRLGLLQQAEQRNREAAKAREAAIDAKLAQVAGREREFQEQDARMRQVAAAAARAKYDPVGVLAALGVAEEDYETVAKAFYAMSPAGKANPRLREESANQLRARGHGDEIGQLKQQVAEMKNAMEQRDRAVAVEKKMSDYLDSAAKAINGKTPILSAWADKHPTKVRAALLAMADELVVKSGNTGPEPAPEEVALALEQRRHDELEEMGMNPDTIAAQFARKTENAPKPVAKTITNSMGTPVQPRTKPMTRAEAEADVLRGLKSGTFE